VHFQFHIQNIYSFLFLIIHKWLWSHLKRGIYIIHIVISGFKNTVYEFSLIFLQYIFALTWHTWYSIIRGRLTLQERSGKLRFSESNVLYKKVRDTTINSRPPDKNGWFRRRSSREASGRKIARPYLYCIMHAYMNNT